MISNNKDDDDDDNADDHGGVDDNDELQETLPICDAAMSGCHTRTAFLQLISLLQLASRDTLLTLRPPNSNYNNGSGQLERFSSFDLYTLSPSTLSLPRVINFKFPLQPRQEHCITQYGELGFSSLTQIKDDYTIPTPTTSLIYFSLKG